MNLQIVGLSYRTAPVYRREAALAIFRRQPGILLATCNRVELYQMTNDPLDSARGQMTNEGIYYYRNEGAIRHLFRVAAGLDSQILGETEILGQVGEALLKADEGRDSLLGRVFERAIAVGRRVREETGLSRGNVSVAGAAVARAGKLLAGQKNKKVVLIGAGKVTRAALKALLKLGLQLILVANRTYEQARMLAAEIGGRAIRFSALTDELVDADLVICSTAAPHPVIREGQIRPRRQPLTIIDLAVPRDVDPEVSRLAGVTLLNVDDLREEINFNLTRRKIAAVFAEQIIAEEVRGFCAKLVLEPAAAAWR